MTLTPAARPTEGRRVGWLDRRIEAAEAGAGNRRWFGGLAAAAGALTLWGILAGTGKFSPLLLPSPGDVWSTLVYSVTSHGGSQGLSEHYLWTHLAASLRRVVLGLLWGTAIGVPLGLFLGLSRWADRLIGPVIDFIKSLPPLGYYPLLILWFGIGDLSKVWLLFIAAVAPITVATAAGAATVRHERVSAALVLGASRTELVRYVFVPSVLGDVVTGLRIASGLTWSAIVAAETINGVPGLGGLAWASQRELRADIAILAVVLIGLTAVAIDAGLRLLERRFAPWKGRA